MISQVTYKPYKMQFDLGFETLLLGVLQCKAYTENNNYYKNKEAAIIYANLVIENAENLKTIQKREFNAKSDEYLSHEHHRTLITLSELVYNMESFVSQMKHGYGDTTTMLDQLKIPIKCANWESTLSRMKNDKNDTMTESNYKDIQDFIDDYIKYIDMHRNELDYEKVLSLLNQYGVGGFKSSIDLLVDWSCLFPPKYQYA
jgi:hypothetical protein